MKADNPKAVEVGLTVKYPRVKLPDASAPDHWRRRFRSLENRARNYLRRWAHPLDEGHTGRHLVAVAALPSVLRDVRDVESDFWAAEAKFRDALQTLKHTSKGEFIDKLNNSADVAEAVESFDTAWEAYRKGVEFVWDFRILQFPSSPDPVTLDLDQVTPESRELILEAVKESESGLDETILDLRDRIREETRDEVCGVLRDAAERLRNGNKSKAGIPRSLNPNFLDGLRNTLDWARRVNPWEDAGLARWLMSAEKAIDAVEANRSKEGAAAFVRALEGTASQIEKLSLRTPAAWGERKVR